MPLTFKVEMEDIVSDAERDKKGNIKEIHLTWAKKGNKINKSWTNTTLGSFTIKENKLTVFVNSQKRAKKVQKLIEKHLGRDAQYLKLTVQSVDSALAKEKKTEKIDTTEIEVFNETPEAKAFMKEYLEKHWEDWLDMSIPALKGLTPRKATETKSGRERLEALFREFESRYRTKEEDFHPDIRSLRKKLGMPIK